MPPRPYLQEPASTVDSLRSMTSDVPEMIMKQANSDVERYLLKQGSILDQQNVCIGETVDRILVQTTATNGRVLKGEVRDEEVKAQLATHNAILAEYQKGTARWRHWQTLWQLALFPFLTAVLLLLIEVVLHYFNLR